MIIYNKNGKEFTGKLLELVRECNASLAQKFNAQK